MITRTKSGWEVWQEYVNNGVGNSAWNMHDCEIIVAVGEFNAHLRDTPGYTSLDWQLVKAMTWVETGGGVPKWRSNPIQIGNDGDPGLAALLEGNEGGDLILPPALRGHLTMGLARTVTSYNLRAGIGYLLMKMANFSIKNVVDPRGQIKEVTVQTGDTLGRIARTCGTTVDMLRAMNSVTVLRPGQTLRYQKAAMRKVITGCHEFGNSPPARSNTSLSKGSHA